MTNTSDSLPVRSLTLPIVLVTEVVFVLISFLISFVRGRPFLGLFSSETPLPRQFAIGLLVGVFYSTVLAFVILHVPRFATALPWIHSLVGNLAASMAVAIVVAVAAGIGEEVLFRGTLQPILGLWGSTILFTLIHGAHLLSQRVSVNGLLYLEFVFASSLILGALYSRVGLMAAVWAHASIDAVLLLAIRRWG